MNQTGSNLESTIEKAKTGDSDAIAALYTEYRSFVYNYTLKRVKNIDDAEDLTSKIFMKVIERLDQYQYQPGYGFNRWLTRLAHNVIVDEWRKSKRIAYWADIPDSFFEPEVSAEETGLINIEDEQFDKYKTYCTPQQARLLDLKYRHDLSNEQVADIMGLSIGAVKSMQHRAFDKIKEGLTA